MHFFPLTVLRIRLPTHVCSCDISDSSMLNALSSNIFTANGSCFRSSLITIIEFKHTTFFLVALCGYVCMG